MEQSEQRRLGRPKIEQHNTLDKHIGKKIRLRRLILGWSQDKLAKAIGLTFQQVQKYERGTNRVSASRLKQLSEVMGASLLYFYDNSYTEAMTSPVDIGFAEEQDSYDSTSFINRENIELARAYQSIMDSGIRRRIFELVRAVAYGEKDLPLGEEE